MKIINRLQPLITFTKSSILDVSQGSGYISKTWSKTKGFWQKGKLITDKVAGIRFATVDVSIESKQSPNKWNFRNLIIGVATVHPLNLKNVIICKGIKGMITVISS